MQFELDREKKKRSICQQFRTKTSLVSRNNRNKPRVARNVNKNIYFLSPFPWRLNCDGGLGWFTFQIKIIGFVARNYEK